MTTGLRQGDPLSPFLFFLVVDIFSKLISSAVDKRVLEGFVVGRDRTSLFYLQFVDDTILFCLGKEASFRNLNSLLSFFEALSGLKITEVKVRFWILIVIPLSVFYGPPW